MIVTLTGANAFLLQTELQQIVRDFVAAYTDMAVERFDGEESVTDRMRESIHSLPFLTARKLVVLREPGKQKQFAEAITEVLRDVPDTTDLVIVEPKLDKRLAYYKALKKITDFREHAELDANGLNRWAVQYVQQTGGKLAQADAKALVDRVGANQQMLQHDLDKLLAFNPQITSQSIQELTDYTPQSTVFELLDAAFSGNTKRMMALYDEQRALRVDPQAILAMVAWQLSILVTVKAAGRRPADEIAKAAKLNPYVVRKSQSAVRNLSLDRLRQLVASLLQLDVRLKRESIDADEATRLLLLGISA